MDKMNIGPLGRKKELIRDVYQQFIQVDVVGLPDVLLKDLEKRQSTLSPAENVKETPHLKEGMKTPEDILPETAEQREARKRKEKEAQREALLARKKKEEQERERVLKELREQANREEALKSLEKEQKKRRLRKGNILSQGTAARGKIGTAKDRYRSLIAEKIKRHFNIYPWQRKKDLVAVIFIRINERGEVTEKKVIQPSHDRLYDSAVLQAVADAQPLPVPVDLTIIKDGIHVEFRPQE